ncbi:MAG: cytochrome P450 [Actinobacteria bacterium]|nr:MAG: cytochrome P450 [Actinomycetota bacterium]
MHDAQRFPPASLRSLRRDPLGFLQRIRREAGDVASFSLGEERVLLLSDPALVRELLVAHHRDFVKQNVLRTRPIEPDPERGLMMNDDPAAHVRGRRIFQPAFSTERLREYVGIVAEHAEALSARWRAGQSLDLAAELRPLTLSILAETAFALPLDGHERRVLNRRLGELLAPFAFATSPSRDVLGVLHGRRFWRSIGAQRELLARMRELVRSRRAGEGMDVASLAAQALDTPDGPAEAQAALDCLGILLAGVDTTATALTWALSELARRPDEMERLRDEALAADGDPERLPRARAVFAETLRLHPASWFIGRRARRETTVRDLDFAPETVGLVSPYLIHRDERLHREPDAFTPERWLNGSQDRVGFLPFGAGPRQCLGERLAWLEGALVLAAIARRWRLEPLGGGPSGHTAGATLAPHPPARLRVS